MSYMNERGQAVLERIILPLIGAVIAIAVAAVLGSLGSGDLHR